MRSICTKNLGPVASSVQKLQPFSRQVVSQMIKNNFKRQIGNPHDEPAASYIKFYLPLTSIYH